MHYKGRLGPGARFIDLLALRLLLGAVGGAVNTRRLLDLNLQPRYFLL